MLQKVSYLPPRLEIILRRSEYEQTLLDRLRDSSHDVAQLFQEIEQLRSQLRQAEQKLFFELHANQELCDLLRANKIPFRSALDRAASQRVK